MNSKKALMTGFMVLVCFMSNAAPGAEPQAILHVLPTEESLGQHWKREVSLLFDPLSKPAVITPETSTLPESFKNEQLDTVANPQSHVSGWGNAQYTLHLTNGPAVYDVQIYRYRDRQRLAEEFDQLLRLDSEQYQHSPVNGLGDAAVFYRSTRTPGSTLWFRRADFKAWIAPSSSVTRWEQDVNLQNLASQLDQRMVQRTGNSAVPVVSVAPASQAVFQVVKAELVSRCLGVPLLLSGAEADVWVKSEQTVNRRERQTVLVCVGARGDISVQIARERFVLNGWQVASAEVYQLGAKGHSASSPLDASVWPADLKERDWLVPWQFRGTLDVNADQGADLRERAFRMVGWALNEERVRTADGQSVLISGPRYVGDPVSPEGLEVARVGRAIHAKLLEEAFPRQ